LFSVTCNHYRAECSDIKSCIHTLSRGTAATESYVSFDLAMMRSANLLISGADMLMCAVNPGSSATIQNNNQSKNHIKKIFRMTSHCQIPLKLQHLISKRISTIPINRVAIHTQKKNISICYIGTRLHPKRRKSSGSRP
jgi:hypothetical protein